LAFCFIKVVPEQKKEDSNQKKKIDPKESKVTGSKMTIE
jgi:hypothetical protein